MSNKPGRLHTITTGGTQTYTMSSTVCNVVCASMICEFVFEIQMFASKHATV